MKTRRSHLKRNHEYDELDSELSIQSVLFPIAHNRSKKTIVPETPRNYNASVNAFCAASVLETPDDIELNTNSIDKFCMPITIIDRNSGIESIKANNSFLYTTPDLKLTNRSGIISILESEYSLAKVSKTSNKYISGMPMSLNKLSNIIENNRRKSLADKILPFDLNDKKTLSKKMPLLEKSKKIRKSSLQSINGTLNDDKCISQPSEVDIDSRKSSNKQYNEDLDVRNANKRFTSQADGTIIFEKSSNLDLTEANIRGNIILQGNLNDAIQTMLSTSSHCGNEVCLSANAAGDNNCTDSLNRGSSLSFQKFNSASIHAFEEEMQINPVHFSKTDITSQNSLITNFNKYAEGELNSFNSSIFQDSLAPTQPAYTLTLLGIFAFVDVRSGSENRSIPIKDTLTQLGATVLEKFTLEVTHVIFRDGAKATYDRATQREIHLVSPLWVDACRAKVVRVSESLFPILRYPKQHGLGVFTKSRKLKSMQPRNFEEDEMVMVARIKKRLQSATSSPKLGTVIQLPESPNINRENVNSPLFGIDHLLTPNRETDSSPLNSSLEGSDKEFGVPLASRMYNRFVTPNKNFSTPLREDEHRIPFSPLVNIVRLPNSECASPYLSKKQSRRMTRSQAKCSSPNKCLNEINLVERDHSTNSYNSCFKKNVCLNPVLNFELNRTLNVQVNSVPIQRSNILENDFSSRALPTSIKFYNNEKLDASTKENKEKIPESDCAFSERPFHNGNSFLKSNGYGVCDNKMLSTCSGLSQPSSTASRRHRLHTVDCDIPEQDLIVPSTPQSATKCQSSIYNNISINDSTSQRMAMKNLSRKALNDDALLPLPRKVGRCSLQLSKTISLTSTAQREIIVKEIPKSQQKTPKGRFSLIPKDRGSLEEFQSKATSRKRGSGISVNVPAKRVSSICITSFHSGDIGSVCAIIKSLGDFIVTEEVELSTTHIVCGSERRTMNVLFGIAKGCWILDVSWLYESVELLKWAPEEPFELFNFCPGAKKHRLLNENMSSVKKPSLFLGVGRIYILDSCSPKLPVMKSLMQMCGANLCSTIRRADLLIGEKKLFNCNILQVSEKWAFDSIQKWELQNLKNYVIH